MSKIPENLVKNQWLTLAFAGLTLVGISIINPTLGEKYIIPFFLTFIYGLVSFFVNRYFVNVTYGGDTEGKDRKKEYVFLLITLLVYLIALFVKLS